MRSNDEIIIIYILFIFFNINLYVKNSKRISFLKEFNKWHLYFLLQKQNFKIYQMNKHDSHDTDENLQIIFNALDTVYPLLSQDDKEQTKLYKELRSNPYSKNSQRKTIKLLLKVLLRNKYNSDPDINMKNIKNGQENCYAEAANNPIIKRLLSHLESHVVLLEAISHNPELASLFLVGSNGSQSFTSLQKSVLMEQASRMRYFISHFISSKIPNCDSISNYRKNMISPASLTDLSEKIEEINSIKNSIEHEDDNIGKVKNAFKEVCSLLETSVLFNDILIQKYNDSEVFKQNEKLEKQIKDIKSKKESIQSQLKKLKHHIGRQNGCLDDENQQCRQKIAQLENEKVILMRQIEASNSNRQESNACEMKTLRTENRQLASQIDLLNKQVTNYQTMISQKDDKINILKTKIEEISQKMNKLNQMSKKQRSEVEEIHNLYKNASNQLSSVSDQLNDSQLKNAKLQKANSKLTKENTDLKALLERANETNQNHLKDNAILIKQMRQNDVNKDTEKEEKLKEVIRCLQKKLGEAQKFICKLQKEIKQYKHQNISSSKSNQNTDYYTNDSTSASTTTASKNQNYTTETKVEKKIIYRSNVDFTKSEEESSISSSSSISLINKKDKNKNKNRNKKDFVIAASEEEESRNILNDEFEIEEEEEENESSYTNQRKDPPRSKKVVNVDDNIVIKSTNLKVRYNHDNDSDSEHMNVNVRSSIMSSFDELERELKNMKISVKNTKNLVSQTLEE